MKPCLIRSMVFFLVGAISFSSSIFAQAPQEGGVPSPTQTVPADNQFAMTPLDYVIGPGDVLSIRVYQSPDMSGNVRVSAEGYIRLLFLEEPIRAAGYSEWELTDVIRKKLGTIMQDPRVSIQVTQARQNTAYILGAVLRPNAYPVDSETRLLGLVAAGGGLNDRAGNIAYILRNSVWSNSETENHSEDADVRLSSVLEAVNIREMLQGKVELNRRIYPGDIVTIPDGDKVFVGGNVNAPGAYQTQGELTLSQAITLAGGLKPATKKSQVKIVRQEPGKPGVTELTVDLGTIEKDASQDVRLQNNDVVYIPASTLKNLGWTIVNALAMQAALAPIWIGIRRR